MEELWQLYDNQGRALAGKGAPKDTVFTEGLLHAASHIWIWRVQAGVPEVLLQKRAADKRTWPSRYDISAAGHIDLGEDGLTAALRETTEEIGFTPDIARLELAGVHRHDAAVADSDVIENEYRYVYTLQVIDETAFSLADGEVESIVWRPLSQIRQELADTTLSVQYVPHGAAYFAMLFEAFDRLVAAAD